MPYRHTDFPYLFHKNPAALKDRIFAAFMEHGGDMEKVFKELGVTSFTYYKYVKWLGIGVQLQSMRAAMSPGKVFKGRKYADTKPEPKAQPAITSGPRGANADGDWDSGVWGPS